MISQRSPRPFELNPTSAGIEVVPEPQADVVPVAPEPPRSRPRPWRRRLMAGLGIGIAGTIAVQAVDYVSGLIQTDPLLGWPMAALMALVVGSATAYAAIEAAELRRLSKRSKLREQGQRLATSELHGEADPVIDAIVTELVGSNTDRAVADYRAVASDALSDGERLVLFERRVLAPVDRAAYRIVLEGSRDIGILTALAPTGLLDGVLVLWRTTLMLRQIARLYGMAPGPTATLSLLRRCVRNAALAGLADIVTHAALEHVGASLIAMLSARAGQGAGNALLAARLGLGAIRECRPLPFVAERPPRIADIRKALLDTPPDKPLRLEGTP